MEESSRIFVKNLPLNSTDNQLRKYFSAGGRRITDVRLILHRRIAFIGYGSPAEAKGAVAYFNNTFIGMSKLSVDVARPIGHQATPKMTRLHEKPTEPGEASEAVAEKTSKKRKRKDLDEAANPRLREFMDVMKPQHGLSSTTDVMGFVGNGDIDKPPSGNEKDPEAALAAAEDESDDEYESLPTRPKKKSKPPAASQVAEGEPVEDTPMSAPDPESQQPEPIAPPSQVDKAATAATDDEWLRSKTNRLLDLVDPSELAPPSASATTAKAMPPAVVENEAEDEDTLHDDDGIEKHTNGDKSVRGSMSEASEAAPESGDPDPETLIQQTSRIFVRNLPYNCSKNDLEGVLNTFGIIDEVYLPKNGNAEDKNKGYAIVKFRNPSDAVEAYYGADRRTLNGRIMHILPGKAKKETPQLNERALSQLPTKVAQRRRKEYERAEKDFSWNALFMDSNTVNAGLAKRLNVSKSELLDPTSASEGVHQAIRERTIIQETKDYFLSKGVDMDSFKSEFHRGYACLAAKNLPFGTSAEELRKAFEKHGQVLRLLVPPSGTSAIIQFENEKQGKEVYFQLSARPFNGGYFMFEKCPKDLLSQVTGQTLEPPSKAVEAPRDKGKLSSSDFLLSTDDNDEAGKAAVKSDAEAAGVTSSLYVKGLNFNTSTAQLQAAFSSLDGFMGANVMTRPDPKKPGQTLSNGYGFVQFRTQEQAAGAIKAMNGHVLAGYTLRVGAARGNQQDPAAAQRAADKARKQAANRGSKLIIKNLPFETTRKHLQTMLKTYGQLRALRMPKKVDNSTRGFAFAEFVTAREAAHAMEALRGTHVLSRPLVIEYAKADAVNPEEEIAKMQKKTDSQVNSVALQQLTAGRKTRAKVQIGEEEEE